MNTRLLAATTIIALTACQDAPLPVAPVRLPEATYVSQTQEVEELPQVPANAVQGQRVPNQYIVVLKGNVSDVPGAARRIAREHGGKVGYVYEASLKGFSIRVSDTVIARLARDPMIDYVEPDGVVEKQSYQVNPVWGLDRIDQAFLPLNHYFSYTSAGTGVRIYVLDTGVRISHYDLKNGAGLSRATYGYDFIDNDAVASDCNGHGTHVAAIAAGRTYGVAKNAKVVSVRVLDCNGYGTWAQVIAGVNWVTAHAIKPVVANLSFSGLLSSATNAAIASSIASGVTYVVSAGGNNVNACTTTPAAVPAAIAVMPSSIYDTRWVTSNYGSCTDLYAPGVSIQSAWNTSDIATHVLSGASTAAPFVAGVAAQYLATAPQASPAAVATKILGMATNNRIIGITPVPTPNKLLRTTF